MDSMEDFEGIKRIKNVNDLTIDSIYELLKNYAKAIGTLKISDDNMHVIGDTEGKYYIDIYVLIIWFLYAITTFRWSMIIEHILWTIFTDTSGLPIVYIVLLLLFIPIIQFTIKKIKGGNKK